MPADQTLSLPTHFLNKQLLQVAIPKVFVEGGQHDTAAIPYTYCEIFPSFGARTYVRVNRFIDLRLFQIRTFSLARTSLARLCRTSSTRDAML